MEKVELFVLGLSTTPTMNNSYTLILKEVEGERRLPIIIGGFEAQAIALEIEEVTPPRPMTHDLFKSIIESMQLSLTEVNINDMKEGTFYASLYFEDKDIEIDARPSDAIAIAIRLQVPIYINSDILDEIGINVDENPKSENRDAVNPPKRKEGLSSLDKLKVKLDEAINNENYELAAQLRDEMQKLVGNS